MAMIGLDISDRTLRAVELSRRKKSIVVRFSCEIRMPPGILKDGEIVKEDLFVSHLAKLRHGTLRSRGHAVCACLPERKSFVKLLSIAKSTGPLLEKTVRTELSRHIPFTSDEISSDWQIVEVFREPNQMNLLVAAAPKTLVESYQQALKRASFEPEILEVESIAIARSLLPMDPKEEKKAVLMIDLGLDRTSFILYDRGVIPLTSGVTTISGNLMTELIAKKLSLSLEDAEKAKRMAGFNRRIGKGSVARVLDAPLSRLVSTIEEIREFYREHVPNGNPIEKIILTGGGSNLKDLPVVLGRTLGYRVEQGNSCRHLHGHDSIPPSQQASYATAIGLALRALQQ